MGYDRQLLEKNMPRRNMPIVGLSLGLVLVLLLVVVTMSLFKLTAIEKEKVETQRRIQFERRASEIKADIEHRRKLLKNKWENDRQQAVGEGTKLVRLFDSRKDQERASSQVGQWLENVDAHYQSAEIDLGIEEAYRIAELREQIWGK